MPRKSAFEMLKGVKARFKYCVNNINLSYTINIMQIYIIYIFITAIPNVELYLLQNQNKKICADCKFFISNKNECSKFGDVDIITGKHNYEPAIKVRNDNYKCGEDAIFFKKNYFKFISITFNFLLENNLSVLLFTFTIFYYYIAFINYHIINK
jgi:hypothetical protein